MTSLNNGFVILDGTTIPQLHYQLKLKYGSLDTKTDPTDSYTTGYTTAICRSSRSQYNINNSVCYQEQRSEILYTSPTQSFPPSNLAVLPSSTSYVPKVQYTTQQSLVVARNPVYDKIRIAAPAYSWNYVPQGSGCAYERNQAPLPLLYYQHYNNEDCSNDSQIHSPRSPSPYNTNTVNKEYDSDEENRDRKRRRRHSDENLIPRNFHYGRHRSPEYSYEPEPERVLRNPFPEKKKKKFRASYPPPPTYEGSTTGSGSLYFSNIFLRSAVKPPTSLYHYTSSDGAFGILSDGFLKPKKEASRFGSGIYFTSIPPHESTESILINNYGSGKIFLSQIKNTEFVFEFQSKNLPDLVLCQDYSTVTKNKKEIRRHIWMSQVTKLDLKLSTGTYFARDVSGFDVPQNVEKHKIHFRHSDPDPPKSKEGSESPIPVVDLE